MRLYRTTQGVIVEDDNKFYLLSSESSAEEWDYLLCDPTLNERARVAVGSTPLSNFDASSLLAPIGTQEVWAAGVTYYRSRSVWWRTEF